MEYDMNKKSEVLVIKPGSTRIDAAFATQFKNELLDSFKQGKNTIVLDLSDVDFIDSSGLGALVSSRKTLGENGEIALCSVKERVQTLFDITRMNKVFRIYNSKEDAISSFQTVQDKNDT
jgi:anti-sigma B factor antagonist